ncbi:MAG: TAT-variant-translocated molybdopterin oxidoreductase [Puniceicoccales bacterium]
MKRKFEHPEPTERESAAPSYWRSPGELAKTPEFQQWLEKEFPEGASEANEQDRRSFLKLMGASAGLAGVGLAGCRMPERQILPYSKQPEKMVQGVPMYFASSFPGSQENIPLVVETNDARPTKIEGNPSDPGYGGATDSYAQASVLDLYDPDRLQQSFEKGGKAVDKAQIRTLLADLNKQYAGKGDGLVFLAQPSTSPTRKRLVTSLKKQFPQATWAEYEPVDEGAPVRALEKVNGKPLRPLYQLDKAQRVLAIDSDFLATEPGHLPNSKGFGKARHVKDAKDAKDMNRLYAVESNFTLTGGMADHRLRAATAHMPAFTALLAASLMEQAGGFGGDLVAKLKEQAKGLQVDQKWIDECVKYLLAHKGESLVVAGPHLPEEVHVLTFVINGLLEADGHTIKYIEQPATEKAGIVEVAELLNGGSVETLVILGGNPAYDAPADLNFADAIGKAKRVLRHGYYDDETSELADVTVASTHYLESWGDGRAICGDYLPVQPMILPLFDGYSELEVIALVQGIDPAGQGYELVKETFAEITGDKSEVAFEQWLAEGVWLDARWPSATISSDAAVEAGKLVSQMKLSTPAVSAESLEVRIIPSTHAWDGRYNNNGWLMECPDPMTKLTWDNAILVSPKLGKKLGITPKPILMDKLGQLNMNANQYKRGKEEAHMGELTVNGQTIKGPLHIMPGLADSTVVITLGFGREKTGRIGTIIQGPGKGEKGIGFNAYPATSSASMALATGAKVKTTEDIFQLANTQEHWSMEGRAIIREANNTEYAKNPEFVDQMGAESHSPPIYGNARNESIAQKALDVPRGNSLYKTPSFGEPAPNVDVWNTEEGKKQFKPPQQWGMNIDLNTCTACNACVIACQAENNIPIVGKDQVLRGREMHWIRLDRYFATDPHSDTTEIPEDPQVNFMSMACQHCELAPCESVCPVNATVHDEQGLNVMAYNRCVGTRYCANNCPYKVRRFNFFDYNKRERADLYAGPLGRNKNKSEASQLTRMQKNPNVTVRMRGVMEKCTYCVQRIEMAKINQKNKAKDSSDVNVPDGTIKVACQQVCPTNAITFGDISDENSAVNKAKQSDRNYSVLGYLNIRPRTTYLAKLRNPNPAMPDYSKMPLSRAEYKAKSGHGDHGDHGAHDDHGAGDHSEKAHANGHDDHSHNGDDHGHAH